MGTSARRDRSVRGSARPVLVLLLAVASFVAGGVVTYLWMTGRIDLPIAPPTATSASPEATPAPTPAATPVAEASPVASPSTEPSPEATPSPVVVADAAAPDARPARPRPGGRARPATPSGGARVEPGSGAAPGGRPAVPGAPGHRFVLGTTTVESLKPVARDLKGFEADGVGVKRAPQVEGTLDLVVEPARITPGQPYAVKVFLKNHGTRPIKVDELKVSVIVDGKWSTRPLPPKVKEVKPSERGLLEELPGVWKDGIKSWAVEVIVTSAGQDVYKNRLTWQ
jgi:hypothetical protein